MINSGLPILDWLWIDFTKTIFPHLTFDNQLELVIGSERMDNEFDLVNSASCFRKAPKYGKIF